MRCSGHARLCVIALLFSAIAIPLHAAGPPPRSICIVDDVPATVGADVLSEWRGGVSALQLMLRQVKFVGEKENPNYTFRRFGIVKSGSGEALSLMHNAWFQSYGAAPLAEIQPVSQCHPCPLTHLRRLFLTTVQMKLCDKEQGLYRPLPVSRCVREQGADVAITVEPANGMGLENGMVYYVGEWVQLSGAPRRLYISLVSLQPGPTRTDGLGSTFEVSASNADVRDRFRNNDCNGTPINPIVLVPRLVPQIPAGTTNKKVQ